MLRLSHIASAADLRRALPEIAPGVYRWWFSEEEAHALLARAEGADPARPARRNIGGRDYLALYFGIAEKETVAERLKWHLAQKHSAGSIRNGFISTLRHTLSALLGMPLSESEQAVNSLMDRACMVEWMEVTPVEDIRKLEEAEINGGYYPLNIRDNGAAGKTLLRSLKEKRKIVKN